MATFEKKFSISVPSSTENLRLIREFISSIASQAGLTSAEVKRLAVAVDEACTNVIEHAYGYDITKEVIVRASFDQDELRIDVEDVGLGFDPAAVESKTLEQLVAQRKTGGLGMRLMKALVDEIHYEIAPGKKNELHLKKNLNKR